MYRTMEEVRESEKYRYFKEMGYTDAEALTLCVIEFDNNSRLFRLAKAFTGKERFSDFVAENYFSDRYEKKEERKAKTAGKRNGIFSSISGAAHRKSMAFAAKDAVCEEEAEEAVCVASEMFMDEEADMCAMEAPIPAPVKEFLENVRTDSYEPIEEKEFRNVIDSPTATFRPTYNTAAAGILLGNIRNGSRTREAMVRTEELLNYLDYELKLPEGKKFEVTRELKQEGENTYLFLGVKGEKVLPARQNICLLLDVSGSMSSKTDSMVMTIAAILSKMKEGDVFSLITYSNSDHVVINGLKLNENKNTDDILEQLAGIDINGCTNGSAGLNKAYEIVEKNMVRDGVNRVIIITDGDLNFGIHDKDGLKGLIEKKKETGAYFSAIGTGIYNLQDDKLEALAKNGNGNYFVVNNSSDVKKSVYDRYEALVYPIARNVKAQLEFNPAKVKAWKLVGYENRMLNHEDFRNDKVIAEPFGSGSYFIALFRLVMNEGEEVKSDLRYQTIKATGSEDIGTLTIRYEDVKDDAVKEIEFTIDDTPNHTANLEKAIECADLADKLRDSNPDVLTKTRVKRLLGEV